MAQKKKAVGVILLARNGEGEELFAISQVRSWWNKEKNAPESWPGGCQVTAHGGLEEGENPIQALMREAEEELGEEIVPILRRLFKTGDIHELINLYTPEKEIVTYGAILEEYFCQDFTGRQKSPSFGGFRAIQRHEVERILNLGTFDRKNGVMDETIIAMFPDDKEAVRLAFEKLG
jgi:8-oxo-dGTP pyrophosphatase MutT (NUDIX family)